MTHAKFDHVECRPAIISQETGKVFPEDHPVMKTVLKLWDRMPLNERVAWHNVCCNNSRDQTDLDLCQGLIQEVRIATGTLTLS